MSNGANISETAIRAALDAARRDLLDLTFRNNFLNYRILKARGFAIADDGAARVAGLLGDGGAPLTFIAREEAEEKRDAWLAKRERGREAQEEARRLLGTEDEDGRGGDDATSAELADRGGASHALVKTETVNLRTGLHERVLVADHDARELDRRLLTTLKTARTLIEERGVNTLFVALGVLQWTESETSDVVRTSPLLLVPVLLERSSVPHGIRMRLDGEDVQGNPTLQERLRQEGVELPLPGDDADPNGYFDHVETAIRDKVRWNVDRSHVSIGFFSFTRYLMYLDLDVHRWPDPEHVLQHPVVSAALGGGFEREPNIIPPDARLDDVPQFNALHHVLEADSTQSVAVSEAMTRRALVIQGPPGTGKSQTITNLLAEAVAAGQRVLFVAEKKAALDVVKRRLDQVGLGPAALEIHSDKATRTAIVADLRRTTQLGRPVTTAARVNGGQRDRARDHLNAYVDALHVPVEPYGKTPFELMAIVRGTGATSHPDLARLGIRDAERWGGDRLVAVLDLATDIDGWAAAHGDPGAHPFRAIGIEMITPMNEGRITAGVDHLLNALVAVDRAAAAELFVAGGVSFESVRCAREEIHTLGLVVEATSRLKGCDLAARAWSDEQPALMAAAEAARGAGRERERRAGVLTNRAWDEPDPWSVREDLTRRRDSGGTPSRTLRRWCAMSIRCAAMRTPFAPMSSAPPASQTTC